MRTMSSESRRARGRGVARRLPIAVAIGRRRSVGWLAASRPVAAAPVMSRDQPADANDDWTLHLALGLEVGAGGTITDFNAFPSNDSTLFFTSVQGHLRPQTWLRRPSGPARMVAAGPEPRADARPRDAVRAVRLDLGSPLRRPGAGAGLHRVRLDVRVRRGAGDRLRPAGRARLQHRALFPLRRLHQPRSARQQRRPRLERRRRVHLPLRPGGAGAQADRPSRTRGGAAPGTSPFPTPIATASATTRISARTPPRAPTPIPSAPAVPRTTRTATACRTSTTPARSRRRARSPIRSGQAARSSIRTATASRTPTTPAPRKPGVAVVRPRQERLPRREEEGPGGGRPLRRRPRTNRSRPSRSRSSHHRRSPRRRRRTGGERID